MSIHPSVRVSRRSLLRVSGALAASSMLHHVSGGSVRATGGDEQSGTALFLELMQHVVKRMEEVGVPSVAVAVVNNKTRHTCALGVTSLENPQLADAETMYRLGPLSGLFTASAMGVLLDNGAIDLDEPVRTYLPSFTVHDPVASDDVRVKDLLTHHTGWQGDLRFTTSNRDDAVSMFVEAMAAAQRVAPAGKHFSYGKSNDILAGHLVAQVTGLPFETALRELTLSPLSMDHSSFLESRSASRSVVDGHTRSGNTVATVDPFQTTRAYAPVDGLFTNLNEVLQFASFHAFASTPPTFISAETRNVMHHPLDSGGSVGPLRADAMGMEWMIAEIGGTRVSMQTGRDRGQSAMMAVVPSEKFAVVVLTNADFAQHLALEVGFLAMDLFTGLHPSALHAVTRPESELEKLAGTYRSADGMTIRITRGLAGLRMATTGGSEAAPELSGALTFISPLTASIETDDTVLFVDFVRDDNGEISWIRHLGQLATRMHALRPD